MICQVISNVEWRRRIKCLSTRQAAVQTSKSDISRRWKRINGIRITVHQLSVQTSFTNILLPHSVHQMLAKQQHNHWRTVASLNARERAAKGFCTCGQNRGRQTKAQRRTPHNQKVTSTTSIFLQSRKLIGVFQLVFIYKFSFFLTPFALPYRRL
jgi:hypothetical protein